MKFSIIIPIYNNQEYICKCLNSILLQKSSLYEIEILVIDDCSTDKTQEVLNNYKHIKEVTLLSTKQNSGPGTARNVGIGQATGDWIMFVDSDDTLDKNALDKLFEYIQNSSNKSDIIAYDFNYDENSDIPIKKHDSFDLVSTINNKEQLLINYLSLHMDGSVIYTLISTQLIKQNKIEFYSGLHEDIDFMFKVYINSHNIGTLKHPIYIKNNRKNSIVNSISKQHFQGIFRAYIEMYNYMYKNCLLTDNLINAYYIGVIGVVATRVREIFRRNDQASQELYMELYNQFLKASKKLPKEINVPLLIDTKYYKIYDFFKNSIEANDKNIAQNMNIFMQDISTKSWNCYDLKNSLFLSPDEIRTCCKRFFVDNKIKGDVVLLDEKNNSFSEFNVDNILKAKKNLYNDINKGVSLECSGCPFLEFKDWGSIDDLEVNYLSIEHHSVCNMKCTYCSETYYGGQIPKYDIVKLISNLTESSAMSKCSSIVWGGGEPTLDKNFSLLLDKTVMSFPHIKQRVITNSTVFLNNLKKYIESDNVSIVTSIDAGSQDTFYEVRNNNNFYNVLENLVKYSEQKPNNITIKYIILNENKSLKEITSFVNHIKEKKLENCNFQISFDFKKEHIDFDSVISVLILYKLLVDAHVRLVFIDDLLRSKLNNISSMYTQILITLKQLGYEDILVNNNTFQDIVIWGAGNQTKNLLKYTTFLNNSDIKFIVDNTPSKIGTKFMGYDVYDPSELKNNNYPIYISASQGSPIILNQIEYMGLNLDRVIKKIIV